MTALFLLVMTLKELSFSNKSPKIKICFVKAPVLEMYYYFTHSILVIHLRHLTENILRPYLHDTKTSGGKSISRCAKFSI